MGRLSSGEYGGRMRTPAERSKALTEGCRTVVCFKLPGSSSAPSASRENVGRGGRTQNCGKKNGSEEVLPGHSGRGKLASLLGVGAPGGLGLEARWRPPHPPIPTEKPLLRALRGGGCHFEFLCWAGSPRQVRPPQNATERTLSSPGQWRGPGGEHAGTISI